MPLEAPVTSAVDDEEGAGIAIRASYRAMADRWDDDDWVGTPPEGHHTRDQSRPDFWARNWRMTAASGVTLVVLIVVLVLLVVLR